MGQKSGQWQKLVLDYRYGVKQATEPTYGSMWEVENGETSSNTYLWGKFCVT